MWSRESIANHPALFVRKNAKFFVAEGIAGGVFGVVFGACVGPFIVDEWVRAIYALFWSAIPIVVSAVLIASSKWYTAVSKRGWFKVCGWGLFFGYSICSVKWAAGYVNGLFGLSPESFPVTVSVLAVGFLPYVITGPLLKGLAVISIPLAVISSYLAVRDAESGKAGGLDMSEKLLIVMPFALMGLFYETIEKDYKGKYEAMVMELAVAVDFYKSSACENIKNVEAVKFISHDLVITAHRSATGALEFEFEKCNLKIK